VTRVAATAAREIEVTVASSKQRLHSSETRQRSRR
jgi:hypothetical protein